MPVLGRTNQAFPKLWLALGVPGSSDQIEPFVAAAIRQECPVDVTGQPGLWGYHFRGADRPFLVRGPGDLNLATDETQATDFVQAHLFQTLCSLGSETIDFYCLTLNRALEEFQISGALQALEQAKQDGHIKFIGLNVEGPALAVLPTWQFHDAFELVLLAGGKGGSKDFDTLASFATERRVGVVVKEPFGADFQGLSARQRAEIVGAMSYDHPILVPVNMVEHIVAFSESLAVGVSG